jgi:undecaprenyl pyrophosphate phosphatase UppP
LALSHMFEQYLNLLVAHIEVVVLDLLDALLELVQRHHFCAFRIYQLLEGLLSQISALH